MRIGLKSEVIAGIDNTQIYIYNSVTESYRLLSRTCAIFVYLLRGCRDITAVKAEYEEITGKAGKYFNRLVVELSGYIKVSVNDFETGKNNITKNDIISCSQIKNIGNQVYPSNIYIRLTNCCDKLCRYCSEKERMDSKKKGYFDTQNIDKLFFRRENGFVNEINYELTGGEPLLYSGMDLILEEFQRRRTWVSLITKATEDYTYFRKTMTEAVQQICFSLDSCDADYVAYITGNKTAFKNMLICMKIAEECNKTVSINMVLTSINKNELERMIEFCIENRIADIHFSVVWGNNESNKDLLLCDSDKQKLYDEVKRLKIKYKGKIHIGITMSDCDNRRGCDNCRKAVTDLYVDFDGEVTLCNNTVIGNLNDGCLQEIWNSEKAIYTRNLVVKQMMI